MNEKKDIGALWVRQAKSGMSYLSGYLEIDGKRREVVCFANKKDGNEKRPDWRIMPSEPRDANAGIRTACNGEQDVPF